jgi:hypothetical protein
MKIRALGFVCSLFAFVLIHAFAAVADNRQSLCLNEANIEFQSCVSDCKDAFQIAKDACRSLDHPCADACRVGYETCAEPPVSELRNCTGACNSTLLDTERACHAAFRKGTPELKNCIDIAQQGSIICRATCRTDVQPDLSLCKMDFNACLNACFSPTPQ